MAGLLLRNRTRREQRRYAERLRIRRGADATSSTTILESSKLESGKLELENHRIRSFRSRRKARSFSLPKARGKGHQPSRFVAPGRAEPSAVSFASGKSAAPLSANAIKFTDCGGLAFRCPRPKRGHGDAAALRDRHTGIGIPEELRQLSARSSASSRSSVTRRYRRHRLGLPSAGAVG